MYICVYLAFVKMVDVALIIKHLITCSCGTTRLLSLSRNNIKHEMNKWVSLFLIHLLLITFKYKKERVGKCVGSV